VAVDKKEKVEVVKESKKDWWTPERRAAHREKMLKYYHSPEMEGNGPFKGRQHTEETKQHLRKVMLEKWYGPAGEDE
jgi:hypothetical protein